MYFSAEVLSNAIPTTGIVGGHNIKLNFGIFSVYPSNGIVPALNGTCVITVDMVSEIAMTGLEVLYKLLDCCINVS